MSDELIKPRRTPWDLKIQVAIACQQTGQVKAVARAELTRVDGHTCHDCKELVALFPPGDSRAVVGDELRFGPNRFAIECVDLVGQGVNARRKYYCVRWPPAGGTTSEEVR